MHPPIRLHASCNLSIPDASSTCMMHLSNTSCILSLLTVQYASSTCILCIHDASATCIMHTPLASYTYTIHMHDAFSTLRAHASCITHLHHASSPWMMHLPHASCIPRMYQASSILHMHPPHVSCTKHTPHASSKCIMHIPRCASWLLQMHYVSSRETRFLSSTVIFFMTFML